MTSVRHQIQVTANNPIFHYQLGHLQPGDIVNLDDPETGVDTWILTVAHKERVVLESYVHPSIKSQLYNWLKGRK